MISIERKNPSWKFFFYFIFLLHLFAQIIINMIFFLYLRKYVDPNSMNRHQWLDVDENEPATGLTIMITLLLPQLY